MIKRYDRNEKQNKGFTLVEVLIAVTILAIIVAPLLHAFVTGAKTNAKAKQIMKSTTVAQNVMEQIKAYSVEDIARQFNQYPIMNYDTNQQKYVPIIDDTLLNDTVGYEAIKDAAGDLVPVVTAADAADPSLVTASIRDAANSAANPDGVFKGQTSNEYYFRLNEVAMESSKYDVAISMKAKPGVGVRESAEINAMNRSDCAYYAQLDSDQIAVKEFYLRNSTYDDAVEKLPESELRKKMTRKIVVDIEDDGTGNQNVTVTYVYTIPNGYTEPQQNQYSEYSTIFDNYGTKESLKAVYLYYAPLYGTGQDRIEVNNKSNLDIDFYLIKTIRSDYSEAAELGYSPQFVLREGSANNNKTYINLCTNVTTLIKSHEVSVGTPVAIVPTDLGNMTQTEYIYDVTVQVYKADSSNPFKEENLLTTLTGSKLDNSVKGNH